MCDLKNILFSAFDLLSNGSDFDWRLSAVNLKGDPEAHTVRLSPVGSLQEYVRFIAESYIGGDEPILDTDVDIVEYDGALHETPVEYLTEDDVFFNKDYAMICRALEEASAEGLSTNVLPNAMALTYVGGKRSIERPIHILFKKKTFSILQHRFYQRGDTFCPLTGAVLTLPSKIDLMIVGENVFVFSDSGASLANDKAGERKEAARKLNALKDESFIRGFDGLAEVGGKRKNLRLFRAMDEQRKLLLHNKKFCAEMARRFSIPCENGVLDATDPADAERILKLLCKRGMVDPFVKDAVEVSGSTVWKKGK